MFQVSQHPSSGVLKTVTPASGTGHNIGTATSLQRGLVGPDQATLHLVGFLLTFNYDARNHELKIHFLACFLCVKFHISTLTITQ